MKRIIILLTCTLALTACARQIAVKPDVTPPENKKIEPEKRAKKLVTLDKWNIRGQLGVNDGKEAWSAQVYWQQRGSIYSIQLFGPFAGGSMKINGKPGKVILTDASNKKVQAKSADALFVQQTGWNLPITDMLYWIKATPAPGKEAQKTYDQFNHLTQLKQAGWTITYSRYTSDRGVDLPSKIEMANNPLKIKIIVSDWKLFNLVL